ncbi:MAG: ribosome assembly RNA-binding protein YhbY [Myxococcales bacterium]|jgi:RNA-binding protein
MPKPLTTAQRKKARGLAHHLEAVVRVGHEGVTEGVVNAVRQALADHELIKVRLHEPEDKKAMADELARATDSALCGLVGHTVILYRRHPEKPGFEL